MQQTERQRRISKGGRICRHTWRLANRRPGAHEPRGLAAKRKRSPAQPQVRRKRGKRGCGPARPRCRSRRHEPPAAVQRAPPASVLPAPPPPGRWPGGSAPHATAGSRRRRGHEPLCSARGLFGTRCTATSAHLGRSNACLSTCASAMGLQTERQGPAGHSSGAHSVGEREQLPRDGPPLRQAHTTGCRPARPRKAPHEPHAHSRPCRVVLLAPATPPGTLQRSRSFRLPPEQA